ncbi:MAG: ATP-binding protein [Gammaproteobacteria bacterium]|nr:ATP-binding protein [Gammaproteobacteria bacterium]
MEYIPRRTEKLIQQALQRGKSVLFLGARQTGKTTLIEQVIHPDLHYSFAKLSTRLRYEKTAELFEKELETATARAGKPPLVFIDEVQKIPRVMDIAQNLIDNKKAQFILTGSSARKLKHGTEINLLPGRVVVITLFPLMIEELPQPMPALEDLLLYGTLPGIMTQPSIADRETDLQSYVSTYLEEEIRVEAVVRSIGSFARFLELAAGEAGKQVNFTRLSQDVGIADTTIANYYQILEDCLIASRVDPITKSKTKRRLIKSPKYLFFDLGVRRVAAYEGARLPHRVLGDLFEQFVGSQLIYLSQFLPQCRIRYWRDAAGSEVDFVLETPEHLLPIEVKWSDKPTEQDARHLIKFLEEYEEERGYIVCRSPYRYTLLDRVAVIPWAEINSVVELHTHHD